MQRISLAWFCNLGEVLAPVYDFTKISEMTTLNLYRARELLNPLSDQKIYPLDLRASRPVIHSLLSKINAVLSVPPEAQQAAMDASRWDIWLLASGLNTLLMGELAVQPVYHVWPKRAYNIEALVSEGETLFSLEVRSNFTHDEKYNIREAGKCLAFEIPTAAAFHIFRCAESVLRRYYETVVGKLPKPKMRNWGVYINNLHKCGADEKIVTILQQIKDMHRNPVIHPETRLDNDESLSLVGIVESAIGAMVRDMKARKSGPPLPLPPTEQTPKLIEASEAGLAS